MDFQMNLWKLLVGDSYRLHALSPSQQCQSTERIIYSTGDTADTCIKLVALTTNGHGMYKTKTNRHAYLYNGQRIHY